MKIHADALSPAAAVTDSLPAERPHPPSALLSVGDVCLALQCGRTFVYELIQKGDLRPIKLGRLTRISRKDFDAFLEDREVDAADRSRHSLDDRSSARRAFSLPVAARRRPSARPTRSAIVTRVEQPCLPDLAASTPRHRRA
jgi:excisionase family DNA binding protein